MTERLIKDILVIGIRYDKAREKCLAKEQLDLETCIDTLLQITHAQKINTDVTTHTVKYKSATNKSTTNTPRRIQSNRERTPPVVRASGVVSARSVLEVNGNNAL